jgi:putative salt-induced outer membrane protein YdiY
MTSLLPILAILATADTGSTVKFTGDAGFVNTTGNTEVTTINLGNKLEFATNGWGVTQTFGLIYGRLDGETNTSLWRAGLRGDRAITARVGLFVRSEFDRNTFAGIRSRFNQSAGLSAQLIDTERTKLRGELGGGYVWQRGVPPALDQDFAAGRAALAFDRFLGEKSRFSQTVEVLPNFKNGDDLRINTQTSLVAPITSGIAMKASYEIRYDGLPEPGFKETDRIFTTGVQVTF